MFCSRCGKENKIGARFCAACGSPLNLNAEENITTQQNVTEKLVKTDETINNSEKSVTTDESKNVSVDLTSPIVDGSNMYPPFNTILLSLMNCI